MSESSSDYDDMDLAHYEESQDNAKGQPYRGFQDQHDYGNSDNEGYKPSDKKDSAAKGAFYDSDSTVDLTMNHKSRKHKKTRTKQNIRYALNRQVI